VANHISKIRVHALDSLGTGDEEKFAFKFLMPLVCFLLLTTAFPLVFSFWVALNDVPFSLQAAGWQFVGVSNFQDALSLGSTWHALYLSLYYAVTVTVLTLAISMAGALLLNESFAGNRLLLLFSILPMGLSTYATAILWRYIYSESLGFINSALWHLDLSELGIQILTNNSAIPLIAVSHSWQMAPFGISFLLAALQVIPPDLYRVATVDRLGIIGRFRHVTLPYLYGTVLATSVLFAIAAIKVFDLIYFSTNGGPSGASTTMTYQIYLQTFKAYKYGYGAALSYILLFWLVALLLIYFYFFTKHREVTSG